MSLNQINWHIEALEFAKKHDQDRATSVAVIERAMKRGAEIAVGEMSILIHEANSNLQKRRAASAPHQEIKRPIQIET